jgi:transcriptional repressor NF-X1
VCRQKCTKIRLDCEHACSAPCHDADCPDLPCKHMVEITCECGHRKQNRACYDFSKDYRRIATAQLALSMQEMQNGGSVELSEILGSNKKKNTKA